jgi:hypothetical protein
MNDFTKYLRQHTVEEHGMVMQRIWKEYNAATEPAYQRFMATGDLDAYYREVDPLWEKTRGQLDQIRPLLH